MELKKVKINNIFCQQSTYKVYYISILSGKSCHKVSLDVLWDCWSCKRSVIASLKFCTETQKHAMGYTRWTAGLVTPNRVQPSTEINLLDDPGRMHANVEKPLG